MAQPRSGRNGDSTVPEDATAEPHTLAGEEEDERGARRAEQQERSPHPVWIPRPKLLVIRTPQSLFPVPYSLLPNTRNSPPQCMKLIRYNIPS